MSKISIIIPAFNASPFLQDAIDSVFEQKPESEIEIIVIDDGSTDDTAKIAHKNESVIYKHQSQQGQAAARNVGLALYSGDYVGFLDADDLFVHNKLFLQEQVLLNEPEVDAVFGRVTEFKDANGVAPQHRQPVESEVAYLPGTMLLRRALANKIGDFNTSLRFGEFVDWLSRARALGMKEKMLQEVVLKRRLHMTNFGVDHKNDDMSGYVHAIHAHMKRMRQQSDDKPASTG